MFEDLSPGQITYLDKIIERIYKSGTLKEVLTLVIRIFSKNFPKETSFLNVLSIMELIAIYIDEKKTYQFVVFRLIEMKWKKKCSRI